MTAETGELRGDLVELHSPVGEARMLASKRTTGYCDDTAEIVGLQEDIEQCCAYEAGCAGEQRHF